MQPKIDSIQIIHHTDETEIGEIGITAKARVSHPIGNGSHRLEWLTSGGVWGIDQNDTDEINDIERGELDDLKKHLAIFNVDVSGFDSIIPIRRND
jgi:hypothetical protein